ncbi:MAG: ABC transporter permease [Bacteroidota bacterium]
MAFSYSLREGLAGFKRARFAAVASTSAMVVALVLIGLFAYLTYEAQQVVDWIRQRVGELEVYLEDVEEPLQQTVYQRIEVHPGVEEADFISRDEAAEIFQREFGGGESEAFIDSDVSFLPASVKVRVSRAYANPDSLQRMADTFATWTRVDEVVFNAPILARVQENLQLLRLIGASIGLIVLLAALFLVGNTIRLTIYARRLLIRTMKLVGATNAFIRRPFVIEGVLQGIVAGVLAGGMLLGLYHLMAAYLPQLTLSAEWAPYLFLGTAVVLGAILGWVSSYLAARRFIRRVALH